MTTDAGWYQHHEDLSGLLRWWDGEHWTSHTHNAGVRAAADPADANAAVIEEIRRQGALSRRAAERRRRYWASTLTAILVFALIIYVIIQLGRHT